MERVKILSVLEGAGTSVAFNELVAMAGLSRGKVLGYLRRLIKDGYVDEKEKRYSLAAKGRMALRELGTLDFGKEFRFYTGIDQYTGVSARSLEEFLSRLRTIDARSLEFHVSRGDFEEWTRGIFNDYDLSNEFAELKKAGTRGNDLRTRLSEIVDKRCREFSRLST